MPVPWEPEEIVGGFWHRLVGGAASYPDQPHAAVHLAEIRGRLATLFRVLGGSGGTSIADTGPRQGGHRLTIRQRIGLGEERLQHAVYDGAILRLPDQIALFADRDANLALYEWLVAYFAHTPAPRQPPADALQADLARLRTAVTTVDRTLAAWPGLRNHYALLCEELRAIRPPRRLPPQEAAVEQVIAALLGGPHDAPAELLATVLDASLPLDAWTARAGYRPFLVNPLWGDLVPPSIGAAAVPSSEGEGEKAAVDGKRHMSARRRPERSSRPDPLVLDRFERLLSLTEKVNPGRKTEVDDLQGARRAVDELDEIALGTNEKRVAVKLEIDLDIASPEIETERLCERLVYPEWDFRRRRYLPDHCRVVEKPARLKGEDWQAGAEGIRRIRLVRRQFESLRARRRILPGQPDGDQLDLCAVVRVLVDRRAGCAGDDRIYAASRPVDRDLSVCLLADVSLSTDSWIEDRRVLDVEKEAMLALTHGLTACGDEHAILAFTSRRRSSVEIFTVKDFDEPLGATVLSRLRALKPGAYTRIGAALRHARARLEERPHRHRLLLLLTDGKPNDIDHYEGRYALEDTRAAVQEARRAGIKVFGVTVDRQGRDYLPYLFGPGAFAIVPHISRLPAAFPTIYRHLIA